MPLTPIESSFYCRPAKQKQFQVGNRPVVLPTITGRGWITGRSQWVLDETDPFPTGYTLGDIWAPQLCDHESTSPDHITHPPDLDTRRPRP